MSELELKLEKAVSDLKTSTDEIRAGIKKSSEDFEVIKKSDSTNSEKLKALESKFADDQEKLTKLITTNDKLRETVTSLEEFVKSGKGMSSTPAQTNEIELKNAKSFNDMTKCLMGRDTTVEEYKNYAKYFETPILIKHIALNTESRLQDIEKKALSIGIGPEGGYILPTELGSIIQGIKIETSPMDKLATIINISGNDYEKPINVGQYGITKKAEKQSGSNATTPKFVKKKISCTDYTSKVPITQRMIDDAPMDITNSILVDVGRDMSVQQNDDAFNNTTDEGLHGILTYASGTPTVDDYQKIQQVTIDMTPSTSTDTYDDLLDIQGALKAGYNGTWLMNKLTWIALLKTKDGDGRILFREIIEQQGVFKTPTFMASPIFMATHIPGFSGSSVSGKKIIAYGDFKQGYLITRRLGIQLIRDIYTDDAFVFLKFRERVGGDVVNFEAIKLGVESA